MATAPAPSLNIQLSSGSLQNDLQLPRCKLRLRRPCNNTFSFALVWKLRACWCLKTSWTKSKQFKGRSHNVSSFCCVTLFVAVISNRMLSNLSEIQVFKPSSFHWYTKGHVGSVFKHVSNLWRIISIVLWKESFHSKESDTYILYLQTIYSTSFCLEGPSAVRNANAWKLKIC